MLWHRSAVGTLLFFFVLNSLKHRTVSSTKCYVFTQDIKMMKSRGWESQSHSSPLSLNWSPTCIYLREGLGFHRTQRKEHPLGENIGASLSLQTWAWKPALLLTKLSLRPFLHLSSEALQIPCDRAEKYMVTGVQEARRPSGSQETTQQWKDRGRHCHCHCRRKVSHFYSPVLPPFGRNSFSAQNPG